MYNEHSLMFLKIMEKGKKGGRKEFPHFEQLHEVF